MASNVQECSFCKEVLRASANPKLLNCHHSYCLGCLEEYVKHNHRPGNIICPKCRRPTPLAAGGLQSLQTNFYIGETAEDNSSCDACGKNKNLNQRCVDCQQNFCDMCASAHVKMASSKQHQLQEISHKPTEDEIVKPKPQNCCKLHQEEIKMFCKQCSDVLCVICKLTVHDGHKCTDISTEASVRRKTISSLIDSSKDKVNVTFQKAHITETLTETNYQGLMQRLSTLEIEKDEIKSRLEEQFDQRKKKINIQLGVYRQKTQSAVKTGQAAYESLNRIIESSQKSLEEQSDLESIIQFKKLSNEMKKIQDVECEVASDGSVLDLLEDYEKCLKVYKEAQVKIPVDGMTATKDLPARVRCSKKYFFE